MIARVLNRLQTRWALSLSQFWFVITYHLGCQWGKSNALSHHSYLAPKEGDVAYEQQCDVIIKSKHLWFRALLVTFDDKTLFHQIHENLKKHPLVVDIQRQLKNQHQIQNFFSNCVKFEFWDGLLYRGGLLYVPDGLVQFQVLQAMHDVLATCHFGFNNTMELVSQDYWWP